MYKTMLSRSNFISLFVFMYFILGVFRSSAYFYESSEKVLLDIGMAFSLFMLAAVGCKKNVIVVSFFILSAVLFFRFNSLSYHLVTLIFLSHILLSHYGSNFKNFTLILKAPFWGSLIGTLLVISSSLFGVVQDEIFIPLTTNAHKKAYGFFNPNVGAIYFSSILIYILLMKKPKLIHVPLYILFGFLVFETHSRTAILTIVIAVVFFYCQRLVSVRFKKNFLIMLIVTLPIFGLISYLSFSTDQYYFFLDKTLWNKIDFISSFRLSRIVLAYDNSSLMSLLFGTTKNMNHELGWLNYIMLYGLIHVIASALVLISYIRNDKFFTDIDTLNYCFILFPTFIITNFIGNLYFSYNLFALMFFLPFCYVLNCFFESIKMAKINPKNIPDKKPTEISIPL